jgi:hypothetical protein
MLHGRLPFFPHRCKAKTLLLLLFVVAVTVVRRILSPYVEHSLCHDVILIVEMFVYTLIAREKKNRSATNLAHVVLETSKRRKKGQNS